MLSVWHPLVARVPELGDSNPKAAGPLRSLELVEKATELAVGVRDLRVVHTHKIANAVISRLGSMTERENRLAPNASWERSSHARR